MPFLGKGWLHVAWLAHLSKTFHCVVGHGNESAASTSHAIFGKVSFRLAHVPVTGLSFVTAMLLGQVSKRRMDPGFSALFWLVKLRIRGSDTSKASNALEQVAY